SLRERVEERLDQPPPRAELVIDCHPGHPGPLGDRVQAETLGSPPGQEGPGGAEDLGAGLLGGELAPALAIGARSHETLHFNCTYSTTKYRVPLRRHGRGFASDCTVREGPMSLYSAALFLHIVGALGLFAALALEWAGLSNLRRARSVGQFRDWAGLLQGLHRVGGPSGFTLIITGIYLTVTRWGSQPWIILGLIGLVTMAVLGAVVTGRRIGSMAKELSGEGALSPALRRQLQDPVLLLSAWLRTGIGLGVVALMSAQAGLGGSVNILCGAGFLWLRP